jgi:glycosyltransferase involved in cell wall biosynthesis
MISVCIITRNEKENLARCLESLKGQKCEIIVVDTGSSDGTPEMVKDYTDKLYYFNWCDDFSAAKNYAVSKASNEYILMLDSDEYLDITESEVIQRLQDAIQKNPTAVGRIKCRNIFRKNKSHQDVEEWISRVFSKRLFYYTGTIHEQLAPIGKQKYHTYKTPVVINHTGYDLTPAEKLRKSQRNMSLLNQEYQRLQQEHDAKVDELAYVLYQMGKSSYLAGDYLAACEYFALGLTYDLNPSLEFVIDMVETYGYALVNSGQPDTALFFENIYPEFGSTADFKFLMGIIYMNNFMYDQAVDEFLKASECRNARTIGADSYLAYYNVGVIYECLGQLDKALVYYKKCGNYPLAVNRLKKM